MTTPHELVSPRALAEPRGFAHAVVAAPGRTVYLAGQTAHGRDGKLQGQTMVEQFDAAAANVVEALKAAGAAPEQLVSVQIFVTDAAEYRASLAELGVAHRRQFGRHYPAMALFEVAGLLDPEAKVELMAIAVVPNDGR